MSLIRNALKVRARTRQFSITSWRKNPSQIYYTENHEWIQFKKEGEPIARVGLSDYAQDKLGDISYIGLDMLDIDEGENLEAGEDLVDIESVKAADTVKMPVTGIVKAINTTLDSGSETIVNRSPENDGWLVEIEVTDMDQVKNLMDKETYDDFTQSD